MKVKEIVAKELSLSIEQAEKLIILRSGGWLRDCINPAEWPGGINAPKFEVYNPEFDVNPTKGYIEYCFSDNTQRQRLDFDISKIA